MAFDETYILSRPISFQEVQVVVMEMLKIKCPRPDRFTTYFFKAYWSFLGHDIHAVMEESRQTQSLWVGLNKKLISLIPKSEE